MDTLLLDPETWDLVLDNGGNIALASSKYPTNPAKSEAYGQAQDAASQIRLFRGELIYDVNQGVPYWEQILGKLPSVPIMKAKFQQAALLVPGVVAATVTIISVSNREVQGQVFITNKAGLSAIAAFIF